MNIQLYKERRLELLKDDRRRRDRCQSCFQPSFGCYCNLVTPLDIAIKFVILIHPIEHRKRIATGRMSNLCLKESHLIRGHDFSKSYSVNELVNDPSLHPVILYPGRDSKNLSSMTEEQKIELIPAGKKLTIFVLDGTWGTANKMLKHSSNLKTLPQICFTPEKPSQFRVRKQPHEACYSTIEAIHHTIELLGSAVNFDVASRKHDHLLEVFDHMVTGQLEFIKEAEERLGPSRYRRVGSSI